METLKKVKQYIDLNQLLMPGEKILVGVSGGVDSVALLNILLKLGFDCIAAHCNFHLRGKESDRDEAFVADLAHKYGIIYRKIDFDTIGFAKGRKISIEMAARELRYEWFDSTADDTGCHTIAVAHHTDDSIETMLLNFIRGTGLKGLTGIEPKNGRIVRPLLCCTRSEIEQYVESNKLDFFTDSTNLSNDYMRNKIRNSLIPLMAEINPSIKQTLSGNGVRIKGAWTIYSQKIEEIEQEIAFKKNGRYFIDIEKLQLQADVNTVLFELLQPFRFNADVVVEIVKGLNKPSGGYFYSNSHCLLKDREYLIIDEIDSEDSSEYLIEANTTEIYEPIHLQLRKRQKENDFTPSKSAEQIHVDADKIVFPLILRKWRRGDTFFPFGMKNSKKVSDLFIDEKLDRFRKNDTWILISENKIIWIVGLRLDNRFKITRDTQNILEISLEVS